MLSTLLETWRLEIWNALYVLCKSSIHHEIQLDLGSHFKTLTTCSLKPTLCPQRRDINGVGAHGHLQVGHGCHRHHGVPQGHEAMSQNSCCNSSGTLWNSFKGILFQRRSDCTVFGVTDARCVIVWRWQPYKKHFCITGLLCREVILRVSDKVRWYNLWCRCLLLLGVVVLKMKPYQDLFHITMAPFLLKWFDFNPSMDRQSHPL